MKQWMARWLVDIIGKRFSTSELSMQTMSATRLQKQSSVST